MSGFGKSFERELGKNTGKWVSNVVFGDKHSTPYRRVGSTKYREPRKTQAELRYEIEAQRIAADNERMKEEQILLIDSAVINNVDAISSIKISNDSAKIIELLLELSIQMKANKWHGNTKEGKIRNKYNEALLEKYYQALSRLKSLEPNNSQIKYFEKSIKSFRTKKVFKKYRVLIILMILGLVVFGLYLFEEGLLGVVLTPLISVGVLALSYKYYRRIIKKKKEVNLKKGGEVEIPEITLIKENDEDESMFFDLNENDRIGQTLSKIWDNYKGKVDARILNRKPIFSADGVVDSILFVGINPSFNSSDDNVFVKSDNGDSLLYGSFFQRDDAPKYFKELESFAGRFNKGYTHINLLYARENDRDYLLSSDHNFIREQLELTYEVIKKIEPAAIILFTDYCRDLVFGKDRWIDPDNTSDNHYVLNGTNFPVFFTDDITLLSDTEKVEIENKIKKSIKK